MYAAKGERGEQGNQGPRGEPCTECRCDYRVHGKRVRYIKSGGKRGLSDDDQSVIIDSDTDCQLVLPESPVVDVDDCDDFYYIPIEIEIKVAGGINKIYSRVGDKINTYLDCYNLDKERTYTFTSVPGGWLAYCR